MRPRTLLVLLLLVGGLGALYLLRQKERAGAGLVPVQHPLLVAFAPDEVTAVRIDNLERAVQIKLERDAAGSWFMTDPLPYPAIDSLVRQLLQMLRQSLGEPAGRVPLEEVRLDPPLIVLELSQGDRVQRLEIGSVDLDAARVHVRIPGHPAAPPGEDALVLRGPRTLYTTLDRNPHDFRDRRITHLTARDVTSIRRRGRVFDHDRGHEVDLFLDALLEPGGWKKVDAPVVTLDPRAMGLIARQAAELQAEHFADDSPRSLAEWGLDPARVTIELTDERGDLTLLHLGYPEVEGPALPGVRRTWFCRREGFGHVFEISDRAAGLLMRPADELYDSLLMRARREDVEAIELEAGGRQILLARAEESWTVTESPVTDSIEGRSERTYPADLAAVEKTIGTIEQTYLGEYLEDVAFQAEEPPLSLVVRTSGGVEWGGRIGKPWRDPASRSMGRLYLRHGDELTGWVGEEIVALLELSLDDFRSRELHRIRATEVRRIQLDHGGDELAYLLKEAVRWVAQENLVTAPEAFVTSVDPLLLLRAERWLDAAPSGVSDEVEVLVQHNRGEEWRFTLARGPQGETLCAEDGLWAVIDGRVAENESQLLENLLSLFAD